MEMAKHDPVMVKEVLEEMNLRPGQTVFDGTIGLAGHSLRFCKLIAPDGRLVGFDWDEMMLAQAETRLADVEGVEKHFVHADYRRMANVANEHGWRPDAILMDLGLNSAQVEDAERGIAFKVEGPLDMRMDRSSGEPASALLNRLSPDEIETILREYGDERWARMIAKRIVERRREKPLRTTTDLVDAVLAAIPAGARDKRIHPATRTFQAVRIAVNRELEGLDEAVRDAAGILATQGTLVILSYHSGEDRVVKKMFRELAASGFQEAHKKPVVPSAAEVSRNPRSRSAKMRVLRKVEA
jgi:16S rRNA (cytosine1402-N4)-methyltransferase